MSGTNVSTVNVGPTAEILNAQHLQYGDAVPTSASRHLEPRQFQAFKPRIATASEDNGWIGPLGSYSMHAQAGSLYGYGVPTGNPQY
jgi:hypothetical protein